MLKNEIQQKLISALKDKDAVKTSVYRMLISQIKNKEIDKQQELKDEEVIQIVRKQITELKDAIEMFKKGNRDDLIAENNSQINILSEFLPPEITDEELHQEIEKIKAENQAIIEKNPKAIIGICVGKLKTKADPKRITAMLTV